MYMSACWRLNALFNKLSCYPSCWYCNIRPERWCTILEQAYEWKSHSYHQLFSWYALYIFICIFIKIQFQHLNLRFCLLLMCLIQGTWVLLLIESIHPCCMRIPLISLFQETEARGLDYNETLGAKFWVCGESSVSRETQTLESRLCHSCMLNLNYYKDTNSSYLISNLYTLCHTICYHTINGMLIVFAQHWFRKPNKLHNLNPKITESEINSEITSRFYSRKETSSIKSW